MLNRLQDIKQPDDNNGGDKSVRRIQIEREKPRRILEGDKRATNLRRERSVSKWGMWFVAILAVVILFFSISILFTGATVKVHPKVSNVSISGTFIGFDNPVLEDDLGYDVMTVTRSASREVPATGEELVEEKASGKIVIFNNYSTAPQKLIANTRFESTSGLIYRIEDAVVVPGRKEVDGETVPGQLEVTVYADQVGSNYNISLVDFTIPGLKGDARFDKIFARSKTEMTGGFSGTIMKPEEGELATATTELENSLKSELLSEAISVKPDGFILFDKAYDIKFTSRIEESDKPNMAKVVVEGVLDGFIFENKEIARYLASELVSSYNNEPVELVGEENILFSTDADLSNPQNIEELNFTLNGGAKIVWTYDELALKEALKNQSKKDFNKVMQEFTGIGEASVSISPFWRRSIPDKAEDIKIQKIID